MKDKEVSAALWEKLEPLLPEAPPRSAQGGRPLEDFVEGIREGRTLTIDEERRLLSSGWKDPLPEQ